jgi:hypothetical protein
MQVVKAIVEPAKAVVCNSWWCYCFAAAGQDLVGSCTKDRILDIPACSLHNFDILASVHHTVHHQ